MMDKNSVRDCLTGKRIGNKEVICVDNAIDYVKKMGYIIIRPREVAITTYSIITLLVLLLLIGTASAMGKTIINPEINASDFLNSERSDYSTIRLTDLGDKVADYKLFRNSKQCLTNCYAEGKAVLYRDMPLFDKLDFSDEKGNNLLMDYHIYLLKTENYTELVPDYEKSCKIIINDSKDYESCELKEIGKKLITNNKTYWNEYNFLSLKPGQYTWRIEAKKGIRASVDFIPIALSIKFNEWAWWNSS